MRLLVAELPAHELAQSRYGRETAAAGLKYKRSLDIINRSYQKQADNIVGRMTIKSLDDLMWSLEGGDGPPRQPAFSALLHPQLPPPPPNVQQPRLQTKDSVAVA